MDLNIAPSQHALKRFFNYLTTEKHALYRIYTYAFVSALINLSLPLGVQAIIGFISSGEISSSWVVLTFLIIIGILVVGFFQILLLTITEDIQQRLFAKMSFEFSYRMPLIKKDALADKFIPELSNRFFDTLTLQKGFSKLLIDLPASVIQIIFGLILLSLYHPIFVFFGLILVVILFLIFKTTGNKGLSTSLNESKYKYQTAHWLQEIARNFNIFKLHQKNEFHLTKTNLYVNHYIDYRKKHFKVLLKQYGSIVGFKAVITGGLLLLGGILVIKAKINLGQFVASEIIILMIMNSCEKLILNMENVYDVLTAVEKIGFFNDLPIDQERHSLKKRTAIENIDKLRIEHLTIKNPYFSGATIKNLTLNINYNDKICIAGKHNSGKSLLLYELSTFPDDIVKKTSINNVPLINLDINSLRNQIGNVSQQENIFNGTILENILVGRFFDEKEFYALCNSLFLQEFVKKLDQGYDTLLYPGGQGLPAHIIKKICFARALYNNPLLVVIDEFNKDLPAHERNEMYDYICSKNQILIAHSDDITFAEKCNRLIIMENGECTYDGDWNHFQTLNLDPSKYFRKYA